MGSKARIVNNFLPLILERSKNKCFVDMFCGSCSVIQQVPREYRRIANDVNPYLIAMWKHLTQNVKECYFPLNITKEKYDYYRKMYNYNKSNNIQNTLDVNDAMIGWVGFMGSYNGRFYDGGYSGHDVKGRDYIGENIRNTQKQISSLEDVEFTCDTYDNFQFEENSIIYCDPPYANVKKYSYNINHDKFWEWCREQVKNGHEVYVSEYQAPDDFVSIWQQELTNSMHPTKTTKPIEKLFVYQSQIN